MKKNSGQTLLEALIALSALVIILSATAVAIVTSVNNSTFIRNQNQANKLAQQGAEFIKSQINSNNMFSTYSLYNGSTKCLDSNSAFQNRTCSATYPADYINGIFKREVLFTSASCNTGAVSDFANGMQVKIDVYWSSGKCTSSNTFCHKQEVRTCFVDPSKVSPTGAQGI